MLAQQYGNAGDRDAVALLAEHLDAASAEEGAALDEAMVAKVRALRKSGEAALRGDSEVRPLNPDGSLGPDVRHGLSDGQPTVRDNLFNAIAELEAMGIKTLKMHAVLNMLRYALKRVEEKAEAAGDNVRS